MRSWRKIKQMVIFLLTAGLPFFIFAGCSSENGGESGNGKLKVYAVGDATGDWGYPSPYGHYARGPGYVRMSLIFDTLVWKDEQGHVPALAESWRYLEAEGAYRFDLRQDVTWHDGEPFTADDVVFTIEYTQKHPYQFVDTGKISGAVALDRYTVQLHPKQPDAAFLDNVAGTLPILPAHIWAAVENPFTYRGEDAVIGSGPFLLLDYNKARGTYLFEANRDYYGGEPAFDRLQFIRVSPEMAADALRRSTINAVQVPAELKEDLKAEGFTVISGGHDWVAKLLINHTREPFDRREFRQAIAYAVDRQALVETCLRGHALPGSPGLLPPDHLWHEPRAEIYPADPARAGELLEGLGYTKNAVVLELELLLSGGGAGAPGAPGEREGEMLREQLAAAGIRVKLRSLEPKTLDSRVVEWQFDLALSGHGGIGGDAAVLERVITGAGFNSARYTGNPTLLDLLDRQGREMDLAERRSLVEEIQLLYALEMPALALYYPSWFWAHDGQADLFYTSRGIASGIPIPLNKLAFLRVR